VIQSDPAERLSLIDEYCESLSAPAEVRSCAREILQSGSDAGIGQGRKDAVQAAAALYLAGRMTDHKLTQDRLAEVADVATVSIRNLYPAYEDVVAGSDRSTDPERASTEATTKGTTNNGVESSAGDQTAVHLSTSPTRDELIEALQRVGDIVDARPIQSDVLEHTTASIEDFAAEFGSWTAAVEAAGYEVNPGRRETITRRDVIEHIQELATDLGTRPTMTEMNERGEMSTTPVYKYFDGWDDALEAAGVADGPPVDT
jgi:hypothetical protein